MAWTRGEGMDANHSRDALKAASRFALTLIDSLDTLAVMGNAKEFKRAVGLVIQHVDFNKDFNTSVFEANIRVVGYVQTIDLCGSLTRLMATPEDSSLHT